MKSNKTFIFLLSLFLMLSCNSKVIITKPSPIPKSFYYDKDIFLIFKIPNNFGNVEKEYIKWKKNSYESFFTRYTKLFPLSEKNNKKTITKSKNNVFFPPILKWKPKPKIPKIALDSKRSKIVWIKILVNETGRIYIAQLWDIVDYSPSYRKTILDISGSYGPWMAKNLDEVDKQLIHESLVAALNMKFIPAKKHGKNIRVTMVAPFIFKF